MPKFLNSIDLNKNQLLNPVLQNLSIAPTAPSKGQFYYDTTTNTLRVWNGTNWLDGGTGELPALIIANIMGLQPALDAKVDTTQLVTTSANGLMTKEDKTKLDGVAVGANKYVHPTTDGNLHVPATGTSNNNKVLKAGATAGSILWATDNDTVTSINGKTGVIVKADIVALGIPAQDTVVTKTSLGIDKIDNTSDLGKPISTATQTALDLKETIDNVSTKVNTAETNAKAYADLEIAKILGTGTAEALDTLKELAEALGNDPNFSATILASLALKTESFTQTIGNGTLTSFVISHGLNTRDVIVQVRQAGTPYAVVYTDVEMTSATQVTVRFAVAPTTNEYVVTITGKKIV